MSDAVPGESALSTSVPGDPAPSGAAAGQAGADPASVVALLVRRGLTLATCESLTGGGVCATLTCVPGASAVIRGGLITYASDLKSRLAGVDADWIGAHGVINAETARQMALGTLTACRADVAAACTGVAGPDPQDGHDPGEVWLAVALAGDPPSVAVRRVDLIGDRAAVRGKCVGELLRFVIETVEHG